jgi:N-acetylmuramoyl-L-alanine amidase
MFVFLYQAASARSRPGMRAALRRLSAFACLPLFFLAIFALASLRADMAGAAAPLTATSGVITGGAAGAKAVFTFDRKPDLTRLIISNPHRLVIDLPETAFSFAAAPPAAQGVISDFRFGLIQPGKSRIVLTMAGPFSLGAFELRESGTDGQWLLEVSVSASTDKAFEALLDVEAETTGATSATSKGDRIGKAAPDPLRPFTVVVDAGHGGIDSGARGASGVNEKDVTLSFAKELQALFSADPAVRVVLTRDQDIFLPLSERVRFARQQGADIFISVHADTISSHGLRGATVYTISEKASDEVARSVANNENLSDAIAGLSVESDSSEVNDILIDLMRRETQSFSVSLAKTVLAEFEGSIRLINNPHRSAGFMVLRAPDVPSVLLELGYLSNAQDERLLTDAKWRAQVAKLVVSAVGSFARTHKPAGLARQ